MVTPSDSDGNGGSTSQDRQDDMQQGNELMEICLFPCGNLSGEKRDRVGSGVGRTRARRSVPGPRAAVGTVGTSTSRGGISSRSQIVTLAA